MTGSRCCRRGAKWCSRSKPRDPRDPFKGYYSALNYDISQLDPRLMAAAIRNSSAGDTAYLVLRNGPEGHAVPVSLYRSMPVAMTGDVVARGTVGAVSPDASA